MRSAPAAGASAGAAPARAGPALIHGTGPASTAPRPVTQDGSGGAADADIVIGADTIVVAPSRVILEKPGNADEARAMLRMLSGAEHTVLTGPLATAHARERCLVVVGAQHCLTRLYVRHGTTQRALDIRPARAGSGRRGTSDARPAADLLYARMAQCWTRLSTACTNCQTTASAAALAVWSRRKGASSWPQRSTLPSSVTS